MKLQGDGKKIFIIINCLFACMFSVYGFAQERYQTLYDPADSCFCMKYNEKVEESIMTPGQMVEGMNISIDTILSKTRKQLLEYDLKDSIGYGSVP